MSASEHALLRSAFTPEELAIVRRAYSKQMLTALRIENPAIEAAFATVPRERFLGTPPWSVSSFGGGYDSLPSGDPVLVYQDVVFALSPQRGVNNGSPSLHAKLLYALDVTQGARVVHIGAGTGYYTAILAELVGPTGHVTAVEFDPKLADQARRNLSDRPNVTVVVGDGAEWPAEPADRAYVNFATTRPADAWIENLSLNGRLVFPLGVPGPQRPGMGGRHSDRGAAICVERRANDRYSARAVMMAFFVCAEGNLQTESEEAGELRAAFESRPLEKVRSLLYKRACEPDQCWFVGRDWALSYNSADD